MSDEIKVPTHPPFQMPSGRGTADLEGIPTLRSTLPPAGNEIRLLSRKPTEPDYNAVFDRVFAEAVRHQESLEAERTQAEALVAELRFQPANRRRLLIRNSRRYQTWAVAQGLIDTSYQLGFREPAESCDFAALATEVVEHLDRQRYGLAPLIDLKASAWSQLANARRICSDFPGAEQAFATAESLLAEGSGDPLAMARYCDLKASLSRVQGRFDESFRLLTTAVQQYRRMGEFRFVGRALIKLGLVHSLSDRNHDAIEATRAGLELLEPATDRQQIMTGRHNLVRFLVEAGRFFEARALLLQVRRMYQEQAEAIPLLRLKVMEGHIALGLSNAAEAEQAYLEARAGFIHHDLGYDAAVVSLDLASLLIRLGRATEVKRLVAEMMPIFRSRQVHREALAALLLFRHAVVAEKASLLLVERMRTYLKDAHKNPKLRFDTSGLPADPPSPS